MASNSRRKAPEEKAVPPRSEWLFRKEEVPDAELVACLCWEYLREVRAEDLGPKGLSDYALGLLIDYRSNLARRKFNDSFEAIPLRVLSFLADHPELPLPLPPWQELDAERRQELNQPMPPAWEPLIALDVTRTGSLSWGMKIPGPGEFPVPRPWTQQAPESYVWAVAYAARYHLPPGAEDDSRQDANAVPAQREFKKENISRHDPRHWLSMCVPHGFVAPAPFLINWMEHTPEDIVRAFAEWVNEAHPRIAPRARRQGTKRSDLRGALRDLGGLRIIRAMTADEFKKHDADYDLLRQSPQGARSRKTDSELDLIKMRGEAVKFFQAYFAGTPQQKPVSWQPRRPRGKNLLAASGGKSALRSLFQREG